MRLYGSLVEVFVAVERWCCCWSVRCMDAGIIIRGCDESRPTAVGWAASSPTSVSALPPPSTSLSLSLHTLPPITPPLCNSALSDLLLPSVPLSLLCLSHTQLLGQEGSSRITVVMLQCFLAKTLCLPLSIANASECCCGLYGKEHLAL